MYARIKHVRGVLDAYANCNKLLDAGVRPLTKDEQLYLRLCKLGMCILAL
jgi:hypothetical protein